MHDLTTDSYTTDSRRTYRPYLKVDYDTNIIYSYVEYVFMRLALGTTSPHKL